VITEQNDAFVFQTDSDIVLSTYQNNDNYLIEYDESQKNEFCAIYFCSNDIYFPNNEEVFVRSIVEQNKYEWFGTRVPYAHKHIFIRDIQKQWYLTGVNSTIDTPEKLLELLKIETVDYKIITLGSSAGGFASVLFGSLLKAHLVLSFNGQFEVLSLLRSSNESVNPILFRFMRANQFLNYFDTKSFIVNGENIFYFYSNASSIDSAQREHIRSKSINVIEFSTSHHGIPFLKCNLPIVLMMTHEELVALTYSIITPIWFSIKFVGLVGTIKGLFEQIKNKYLKF